jgi:hypothetical protein
MTTLTQVDLAKLNDQQLAEIAHQDETLHQIGDLLRIGGAGDTDFASVKLEKPQYDRLIETGELETIKRGLLAFHRDKIADIKFEFKENGSPEKGTVRVAVTSRPGVLDSKRAGIEAMYAASHSISSSVRKK